MTHPAEAVLAQLTSLFAAAPALEGVRLFDGPPLAGVEDPDVLAVGVSIEQAGGSQGDTRPGWGGTQSESFEVRCFVSTWSGDTEIAPLRTRAFALFTAARDVVDADRSLGGACEFARVVRWNYRPDESDDGASALIDFAILVDARTF